MILTLVDAYGYIFRAYYALPSMNSPDGTPVGAVYGFCRMILNILERNHTTYFAVVFDSGKKTKRHDIFPEYKAQRQPTPDDLKAQFPVVRKMCKEFGIPTMESDGYEADDIIATYAKIAAKKDIDVRIFSGDKDLMQLINGHVSLIDPIKNKQVDKDAVLAKFGVTPDKVIDVQSLMGDTSDNIPGVPGIGPKTASQLINEFGSLDAIYENIDKIPKSKRKENIINFKESAYLSKKLVTLIDDAVLPFNIEDLVPKINPVNASKFAQEYGFASIAKNINELKYTEGNINPKENYIGEKQFIKECNDSIYVSFLDKKDAFANGFSCDLSEISYKNFDEIFKNNGISKIFFDLKSELDNINYKLYEEESFHDYKSLFICALLGNQINEPQSAEKLHEAFLAIKDKKEINLDLYYQIDKKMPFVLKRMEENGIKINKNYLEELKIKYNTKIEELKEKIYAYVGSTFNIDSPKQLSHILFEKLNLPTIDKTKSGQLSTDSDTLNKLSKMGHEFPSFILEYRMYTKLLSTYVIPLIEKQDEKGYIHTTFSHTSTITGRLASSNPNIQNIPARIKDIREAFISSSSKHSILSFDYSQIELRLLAHFANENVMIDIFNNNEDIHNITAKKIFMTDEISNDMRRKAKTINFGIIYGMSGHGLSEALNIDRKESEEIISSYFNTYPNIKKYIEEQSNMVKEKSYVKTIFGRKIYIKDANSDSFHKRQFALRQAANAPLQGSNAEIIKLSMVKIDKWLINNKMKSKMILQIHDELVFDAFNDEIEILKTEISKIMETCVKLLVPIKVNISIGNTWGDFDK